MEDRALLAGFLADVHTVSDFTGVFDRLDAIPPAASGVVSYRSGERYLPFTLDRASLASLLSAAPMESSLEARQSKFLVSIPAPNGVLATFDVVESPVMEPALAARFPEIKTYYGQGVSDGAAKLRFDLTPLGFHAQVLSPNGDYFIDPYYHLDQSVYVSYYRADLGPRPAYEELTVDADEFEEVLHHSPQEGGPEALVTRRDVRTAITTTTAFNSFWGNTVTNVLSAVTTGINRVSGVMEVDMAIRLLLVSDTTRLFSGLSGPGTDNPNGSISGGSNVSTLSSNNQSFTDSRIGNANYDIGHVLHSGAFNGISGGGIGIVGRTGLKAQAASSGTPSGDPFYIDYVAHEMGHQFGGRHNFNNCSGSQGDSAVFANEPGSGSTIMGYAGICGATNLQNNSDAYFNYININQINAYMTSGLPTGLPAPQLTTNNTPIVNALVNYTIPDQTPFRLSATGYDPDGDVVTYTWEQSNTGAGPITLGTDPGSGPIVRSRTGTTNGLRLVPPLVNVLNNTTALGDTLPQTTRTLNFNLTARDNRAGAGGVTQLSMVINSTNSGTGFAVTAPNTTGITWPGGSAQTVTWNVSGSNAAPINTANVRIRLSTDGGNTFPYVLAMSTPNDGSETVNVPFNLGTTQGRIMVEAVDNIFYDINNFNFSITNIAAPNPPTGSLTVSNVTTSGGTSHTITVSYTDNLGISVPSIGSDDIVVQTPQGFVSPVTFLGIVPSRVRSVVVAQYAYTPPGGTWDPSDNGTYTVLSVPGAVLDLSSTPINGGILGTFLVNISPVGRQGGNPNPNPDRAVERSSSGVQNRTTTFDPSTATVVSLRSDLLRVQEERTVRLARSSSMFTERTTEATAVSRDAYFANSEAALRKRPAWKSVFSASDLS